MTKAAAAIPALVAILLNLLSAGAIAQEHAATDPHSLYETRCARCHGDHAGEFVAKGLKRTMAQIVSMLERGHGGLDILEAEIMAEHLKSIQATGGLYREKCRICHDRAVEFARRELVLRDGRLAGRYSGRDIEAFLRFHGRLTPDERNTILEMLVNQLNTEPDT